MSPTVDLELVATVAGYVGRKFPMVARDDIRQELAVWWLTHGTAVKRYLDEEEPLGARKLQRALRNRAVAFCQYEKAARIGYEVEDLFFYSPGLLRELLPAFYDGSGESTSTAFDPTGRSTTAPNEGNNFPALMEDVGRGVAEMSVNDQTLLGEVFRDEIPLDQLGINHGVDRHAMDMRVQRALERLRDRLGGARPELVEGLGSRRVMSNAAAQALTRAEAGDQ